MASYLTWHDLCGYMGSATVVLLYFLNMRGLVDHRKLFYPATNLAGCFLIMISLSYDFNPASFLIEIFWSLVSIYGIIGAFAYRKT